MKILMIFLVLIFIGCNESSKNSNITHNQLKITHKPTIKYISEDGLKFKDINNTISYEFNKTTILVFLDDSLSSNNQKQVLQDLNKTFYIIKNKKLITFFKIKKYPTILVINKKQIHRYIGFIPKVVLQYELKGGK